MIITRTPLRISFAGGGTDIPEYYTKNQYGAVCSLAIDKYVYVCAKALPEEFPYRYKLAYSETELLTDKKLTRHPILREALRELEVDSLDLSAMADIQAGTGMGSSSTFSVGVYHALALLQGKLLQKEELAQAACNVEINLLKEPIGKQDQYAAAYGGLNYIRFNADESVQVEPVVLDPKREAYFMEHLRLYSLGTHNRRASEILKGQKKHGAELDRMRYQAALCVEAFTHGTPEDLGKILKAGWADKKRLSQDISNREIDALLNLAIGLGAYGGKLLGAGGCGFLLICAPPDATIDIGLKRIPFAGDYQGSVSYYLG
jgi:D-glycero-alpha-D-manno-heptose-7-phosphate kinase